MTGVGPGTPLSWMVGNTRFEECIFTCQSLSRKIYVICLSPLSASQNVKEKQLLKCSTLSLCCLSILLWHARLLFVFVHACALKVKTHPEYEQRGVPSLECMGCLKYLENLSKEACAMAEWHVCLQPCVTAWGTMHMLLISPDVMWLWNTNPKEGQNFVEN